LQTDAYGIKRHEAFLHFYGFYITILARAQYKSKAEALREKLRVMSTQIQNDKSGNLLVEKSVILQQNKVEKNV
jgi:hypothetical protein